MCVLLPTIFNIFTPTIVLIYGSTGLIVCRFMTGIGEGVMFPAAGAMVARWLPPQERTKISTMLVSGTSIGTVLGNALSGVLIQQSSIGWSLIFYFFGCCGVFWFLA